MRNHPIEDVSYINPSVVNWEETVRIPQIQKVMVFHRIQIVSIVLRCVLSHLMENLFAIQHS